jgi:hypothetical protein
MSPFVHTEKCNVRAQWVAPKPTSVEEKPCSAYRSPKAHASYQKIRLQHPKSSDRHTTFGKSGTVRPTTRTSNLKGAKYEHRQPSDSGADL